MALSGFEAVQRSLDDIRADYADSRETAPSERPVAFHGATQAAYQRWVDDEVRELPESSTSITLGRGDT